MPRRWLPRLLLSTIFTMFSGHAPLFAASLTPITGGVAVSTISGNGLTVVGNLTNPNTEAVYWTAANGATSLGDLSGGSFYSYATNTNYDGSVVVGSGHSAIGGEAFRWTQAGGMQGLGHLGAGSMCDLDNGCSSYYASSASAVSANGNIVVGKTTSDIGDQAYRWTQETGMVGLGGLGGYASAASDISADGSVIVGSAYDANYIERSFRWTQETGVVAITSLWGDYDHAATGVSGNGQVIIGNAYDENYNRWAYRWTQSGGMINLGAVESGLPYYQNSANAINADGSVIVGSSGDGNHPVTQHAFRWTQATGIKSLSSILTEAGVNTSTWLLNDATGVSDDGNIIVGTGYFNSSQTPYIANVKTGGLTTPTDLGNSLQTVQQTAQQVAAVTRSYAPSGLFLAQNMPQLSVSMSAPAPTGSVSSGVGGGAMSSSSDANSFANLSTNSGGPAPSRIGAFLLGSVGIGHNNTSGNNQLNGTIGINAQVSDSWNLGLGMIAGKTHSELAFDGNSRLTSMGGMALASYTPYESPLRIFAAAFASDLSLDNKRGYLNGSGLDFSQGKTGGFAYGAALRFGWEKMLPDARTTVMPYVEGRYSKTKLDGYSENGGAFDATFSEQEDTYTAGRLGVEFKHQINDKLQVMFRPAWGHRFGGNGDGFTATTGGLAVGYAGQAGDRDWAEGTVGASYRATDKLTFTTELSARTGNTSEPQASVTVGAFMRF